MNPTKYAVRQGVRRQSVLKAIKVGRLGASVTRDARGRYDIDPARADAEWAGATDPTRAQAPVVVPPGQAGESFHDAKARRESALATMAEIELKRRAGELIPASEVGAALAKVLSDSRSRLLALPARIRGEVPEMGTRGFVIATDVVRDVLTELAGGLESMS